MSNFSTLLFPLSVTITNLIPENAKLDTFSTDIKNLTVSATYTLPNPTGTFSDGKRVLYRFTQGGTGNNTIILDSKFKIPSTSTSPLPFSTAVSATDLLGVMYNQPFDRWDVISFIPGY